MEKGTTGQTRQADLDALSREASEAVHDLEAREQERSRLAEELHDGPAQTLANAIFQIEILSRDMSEGGAEPAQELDKMRRLLQRELETLRAYISQLRPPLSEPGGLDDALRDSATSLTEYTSIPIDVRLDAPASLLEDPARMVALRVAQEALRNIGKHSDAQTAWLITRHEVRPSGDVWIMEVGDDGRGFDVGAAGAQENRRHFGLRFMRERSDLLGSQLFIETAPGAGTLVRLIIGIGGERS